MREHWHSMREGPIPSPVPHKNKRRCSRCPPAYLQEYDGLLFLSSVLSPFTSTEQAMGTLIISHKVKDYSTWRPVFDNHTRAQKSAGLTNPRVFRSSDDKNDVVILFDTDDTQKAKDFVASPDLKETMVKAGVIDKPTAYFLESAALLRVMGTGWIELLGLHGADEANK